MATAVMSWPSLAAAPLLFHAVLPALFLIPAQAALFTIEIYLFLKLKLHLDHVDTLF